MSLLSRSQLQAFGSMLRTLPPLKSSNRVERTGRDGTGWDRTRSFDLNSFVSERLVHLGQLTCVVASLIYW
jgi:hypothetical protein